MKNLSILILLSIHLIACGQEGQETGKDGANCYDASGDTNNDGKLDASDCIGPAGPAGPAGADGEDGTSIEVPATELDFSGYYTLTDDGYIELVKLSDGTYNIVQQNVHSSNADESIGKHPRLPSSNLKQIDDTIVGIYRPRYYATSNSIIDDETSSLIDEARYTKYTLSYLDTNKLSIRLDIYDVDYTHVSTTRIINEE